MMPHRNTPGSASHTLFSMKKLSIKYSCARSLKFKNNFSLKIKNFKTIEAHQKNYVFS